MQDGDHKRVVHLVLSRLFHASPINSEANRRQVHGNEVTAVSRPLTGTCGWEEVGRRRPCWQGQPLTPALDDSEQVLATVASTTPEGQFSTRRRAGAHD